MMTAEDEFEIQNDNPRFLCRDGPARPLGRYSQKKLCFTATDRALLARHLLRLSRRADCFWVKFGLRPRANMYLGRCFLTSDRAVGEVWAEYKEHPSLLCTVQDDDFTAGFRELSLRYDGLWLDEDQQVEGLVMAALAQRSKR